MPHSLPQSKSIRLLQGGRGGWAESDGGFVGQNNIVVDPLPLREQAIAPSMVPRRRAI
uniref:hypothetical protein n=1 Tax=Mesorhizobium atlanticum TaxID=2233532 RepID=UPI00370451FD